MEKRMEPLLVRTTHDGQIWIEQNQNGEDNGVLVDPAQVPTLIEWLQEAVTELQKSKEKTAEP
jgi:hypothetical protein